MPGLNVPLPKPTILQPGEEEKQLVQGYRDESKGLENRLTPIREQMGALENEMRGISDSMPKAPQLPAVPEFQPRQIEAGEMMAFATMATVMASLGASLTRTGMAGALNAAAGAIKGFNEGNIQQAKLDSENFQMTMRGVIANNNRMLSEYSAVLNDRKLTLAQRMQHYSVLAHKYQDEIAISALKKGDIRFELERIDKLRAANQQTEMLFTRLQGSIATQLARIEAGGIAALDKPLPASDLVHYVHPQTGARPAPGATLRQVLAGGYQIQSTAEQNKAGDVQGAFAMVDRLDNLVGQLWGKTGEEDAGAGWRVTTGALWGRERLDQSNLALSSYDAFIKGSVAPLIRSLGEKGTLATEDVERALNFLPNTGDWRSLPDTPKVAREKMTQLRQLLTNATKARPQGGAPTGGPKEGERGISKSGKPVIFRNGRWEYL